LTKGGYTKTHEEEEQLPTDWDCTRFNILECKEGGFFKIRLLTDPDRNWPPDCEGEFETQYEWRGLRRVAKAWPGASLIKEINQWARDEDMDLFDFPTPTTRWATSKS
jgi:hypothetical protein